MGATTASFVRGGLEACGGYSWRTPGVSGAPETGMGGLRPLRGGEGMSQSPCGPAGRLALDPLPASATSGSHSVVAENRRQLPDATTFTFPAAAPRWRRRIRKHAVGILAYHDTWLTNGPADERTLRVRLDGGRRIRGRPSRGSTSVRSATDRQLQHPVSGRLRQRPPVRETRTSRA